MKKLLIVLCLALAACSCKGVETGNPTVPSISQIAEGSFLITTADGSRYTFEISGNGKGIIKSLDGNNNVVEAVTAELVIDEASNSFTITANFYNGTKVVISGYLNDDGSVLSLAISVNDVTVSSSVCSTSDTSNVNTIKPCSVVGEGEGSAGGSSGDAVYWVSSSEGSDQNPGTITEPLKTISKALEKSQDEATYKNINVVGGDYNEGKLIFDAGIGIYGGYGKLTPEDTREKDIAGNPTNLQLAKCGISAYELTLGDIIAIDGFNITAPGMVFCINDVSVSITNNHIHATLSDGYFIDAILISSSKEKVTLYANIENNIITVDDIWIKDINTAAHGVDFYTEGSGTNASLNLKDNHITVGDGRGDSYGVMVSQQDAATAYFVATGNTIRTGTAGRTTSPILLSSLSGSEYTVGGTAVIERNTLIAGDIDQTVKSEYQLFGADTSGIRAWGFGEVADIINNVIVSGEHGDYSDGIAIGYGNFFIVYNNTIVARETTGESASNAIFLYDDSTIQAVNNIICADNGNGIYKYDEATILTLFSNLFCEGMNKLLVGFVDGDYVQYDSFDDFPMSNVNGNLIGDPKFVDENSHNLHILFGSDAIDVGSGIGAYNDIDGQARPNGAAFDIGADEYY